MGIYNNTIRSLSSTTTGSVLTQRSVSLQSMWKVHSRSSTTSISSSFEASGNRSNEDITKPKKLIKLRQLKNGGTTIKNDSGEYDYYYNPVEVGSNPYITKSDNNEQGFSMELLIDSSSKNIFLPDLPTQRDDSSSFARSLPIFENSSTSIIPNYQNMSQTLNDSGGVTINGKIKMVVTNTKKPILLKSHSISLKCFVSEYACFINPERKGKTSGQRIIKLLKNDESDISHMLPCKELKIEIFVDDNEGKKFQCLTVGSYEFPFTFTLKLNEFPTSTSSYFGMTFYRIESNTKILKNANINSQSIYDTILLSDEIKVKRVLPTTSNVIKYESVTMQGYWNNHEITYNIMLSTKMIEIGIPFGINVGLFKKALSGKNLDSISISLTQSISVPCINSKTSKVMTTSYVKKNMLDLYKIEFGPDLRGIKEEFFQYYEIENVKIPENDISSNTWLRPFYCEISSKYGERARLKITHTINVKLVLSNFSASCDTDSDHLTYLTFKIPILLVDKEMTNSLCLPPYIKFQNIEDLCDDEPPQYPLDLDLEKEQEYDTITPPCYTKVTM